MLAGLYHWRLVLFRVRHSSERFRTETKRQKVMKMGKVLVREATNNGYGCSCCGSIDERTRWIDEGDMMTPEALLKYIKDARSKMSDDHSVGLSYEKDGDVLYGFRCDVFRAGERAYIIRGKEDTLYLTHDFEMPEAEAIIFLKS